MNQNELPPTTTPIEQRIKRSFLYLVKAQWVVDALSWLRAEPEIKGDAYQEAHAWGEEYMERYLPDGFKCEPDGDCSVLLYEHAISELNAIEAATEQINTKCVELLKLLIAVTGAIVAAWRILSTERAHSLMIYASNWVAFAAILCFITAVIALATCLRSHDAVPAISTRKLLDWAKEERPEYVRIRSAIRIERALAANRTLNAYLAKRLDLACHVSIIGFVMIAFSLAMRFV